VKIATWNVNGIRARQNDVLAFIEEEKPDVLCLQEIKALPDQIPADLRALPDYWSYWHGMKGYSGVSVQVRKDFSADRPTFMHPEFDHETRIAVAEVAGLSIASIYVPNGGKNFEAKVGFLQALSAFGADARRLGRRVILCGDMNVTRTELDVHPRERNELLTGQRPDERALFAQIMEQGSLHDVGRELDPNNPDLFTWWAPWRQMRERNIGWRLDYLLASTSLAERARSCVSRREFGTSDHGPVVAVFDTDFLAAGS
jgi:exodeoxyribonuclease-3